MSKPAKIKEKHEAPPIIMARAMCKSFRFTAVGLMALTSLSLFSGCEALDLINSVGSVLAPPSESSPTPDASASPTSGNAPTASSPAPSFTPTANPGIETGIDVVKASDPVPVSTDWNLARKRGNTLQVSSFKDSNSGKERLLDGNLDTSWSAHESERPAEGKLPTLELQFANPAGILSVNLRGDRQNKKGLNIEELNLLAIGTEGILANETLKIAPADGDINLVFKKPLDHVKSLRLTITRSTDVPALAEFEVLGR